MVPLASKQPVSGSTEPAAGGGRMSWMPVDRREPLPRSNSMGLLKSGNVANEMDIVSPRPSPVPPEAQDTASQEIEAAEREAAHRHDVSAARFASQHLNTLCYAGAEENAAWTPQQQRCLAYLQCQ